MAVYMGYPMLGRELACTQIAATAPYNAIFINHYESHFTSAKQYENFPNYEQIPAQHRIPEGKVASLLCAEGATTRVGRCGCQGQLVFCRLLLDL